MPHNFHDINGLHLIGIEGHSGFHIFPPAPMWFFKLTFLHPFVLGDKAKPTVLMNGVPSVTHEHEPKFLWPHLGIIPDPLDLLTPLHIAMGSQKCWLPRGQIMICGETSTCCVIFGPMSLNADCWEVGLWPTSLVIQPGTVQTTPTLMDFLMGAIGLAINAIIDFLLGKLMDAAVGLITRGITRGLKALSRYADRLGPLTNLLQHIKCVTRGDPVNVATGDLMDRAVDLTLPGPIELELSRTHLSRRAALRTTLGYGGWSCSLDLWLERTDTELLYHDAEGRVLRLPVPEPGHSAFVRAERIEIHGGEGGAFRVLDIDTERWLRFDRRGQDGKLRPTEMRFRQHRIQFVYDGDRLIRADGAFGRSLVLTYTHGGRLHRAELWAGGEVFESVSYRYGQMGDLIEVRDVLDRCYRYEYDEDHRMIARTLPDGARFQYTYDPETGWCVRSAGDDGLLETVLEHDPEKMITKIQGVRPRNYHVTAEGLVQREELLDGTLVGEARYNDYGELVAARAPGLTLSITRDERGNPTLIAGSRLWIKNTWEKDRLLRDEDSFGLGSERSYDAHGNLIRFVSDTTVEMDYDAEGRLSTVRKDGREIMRTERTEDGFRRHLDGVVFEVQEDALGRVLRAALAGGGEITYERDARGRVVAFTERGRARRLTWDALDRVTGLTGDPTTDFRARFSSLGGLIDFWSQRTGQWHIERNRGDDPIAITAPSGEVARFDWHPDGRLCSENTLDGRRIDYDVDAAGRVTATRLPDGTSVRLSYMREGFLERIETDTQARRFVHLDGGLSLRGDLRDRDGSTVVWHVRRRREGGRIHHEERQGDQKFKMEYTHLRDPDRPERLTIGRTELSFSYDEHRILREVRGDKLHATRELSLTESGGFIEVWAAPGGARIVIERDRHARLLSQRAHRADGSVTLDRAFRWAESGAIASVTDNLWGRTTCDHDAEGNLVRFSHGEDEERYEIDSHRAIVAVRRGGSVHSIERGPGGRPLRTGKRELTHDSRGRRTEERGASTRTFEWDDFNHLRTLISEDGRRTDFTYDAMGRLVKWQLDRDPKSAAHLIWHRSRVIAELGREERVHVYVPEHPVPWIQIEDGTPYFVLHDVVGRVTDLLAMDGTVAHSRLLGPFGHVRDRRIAGESAPPIRSAMLGQILAPGTDLGISVGRVYSPSDAGWLSPDPLGIAGDRSAYAFGGSPLTNIDPLGAKCVDLTQNAGKSFDYLNRSFNPFGIFSKYQDNLARYAKSITPDGLTPPNVRISGNPFISFFHNMEKTGLDSDVIEIGWLQLLKGEGAWQSALAHEMTHFKQWEAFRGVFTDHAFDMDKVGYELSHYFAPGLFDYAMPIGGMVVGAGGALYSMVTGDPTGYVVGGVVALGGVGWSWKAVNRYQSQYIEQLAFEAGKAAK